MFRNILDKRHEMSVGGDYKHQCEESGSKGNHIIKKNGLSLSNANRFSMSGRVCILPPFLLGFCLAWPCTDNHYDVVSATIIFKSKFSWYYPSLWFS